MSEPINYSADRLLEDGREKIFTEEGRRLTRKSDAALAQANKKAIIQAINQELVRLLGMAERLRRELHENAKKVSQLRDLREQLESEVQR